MHAYVSTYMWMCRYLTEEWKVKKKDQTELKFDGLPVRYPPVSPTDSDLYTPRTVRQCAVEPPTDIVF